MQSFVEVIKLGSFSEAAKILGLSRALISRHVTDLEKHLGVRLLTRTTRRITLTEAGAEHFNFCQRIIKEIEAQDTSLKRLQREPAGSLKILAPKSLTTLALGDAIASFAAAYPHLHISLMLDDLSFRSYDFIERGFDVAVHTTPVRESSLVARKIANLRWLLCASPKYLVQHGEPRRPRDLTRHQCLVHVNSDPSDRVWRLRDATGLASVKSRDRSPPIACSCCARPRWRLWASQSCRPTALEGISSLEPCASCLPTSRFPFTRFL